MKGETNCLVQSGDVQLPMSSNSAGKRDGNAVGSGSISGALERKVERQSWDKSSAQVFKTPGMWTGSL